MLDRIDQALRSQQLDPQEFERAAIALLSRELPGLAPVSGGSDFGRDADLSTGEVPVRVLATTGDARKNIRSNVSQLQAKDEAVEAIIVVTSRQVGAPERERLAEVAGEFGVQLLEVYDQRWLAEHLYRDAGWRQRLTGVTGEPSALTSRPLGLASQPGSRVPLVGRDELLTELANGDEDVLLVGWPGMGKTRVVASLPGAVFLADGGDLARLADDVRWLEPSLVVVDDAHEDPQALRQLSRIRTEGDHRFRISGVSWPNWTEELADELPEATRLELEPLERPTLAHLLEQVGVTAPLVLQVILDEAEGRPGWALMLGELARRGQMRNVLGGHKLIEEVERFVRQSVGDKAPLDVLARVAALGGLPASEVSGLAADLGCGEHQLSGWLEMSTVNGLAEFRADVWHVRPERLAGALVAHWFFRHPPRASIDGLVKRWPERRMAVLRAVVDAALAGSEEAAFWADRRLTQEAVAAGEAVLDEPLGSVLASYALVDGARAREAVRRAIEAVWARVKHGAYEQDWAVPPRWWSHAEQVVERAARKFDLQEAADALADLALLDPRDETRAGPRQTLVEMATEVLPGGGCRPQRRTLVMNTAVRLLQRHGVAEADLAAELAAAALKPSVSGTWSDPIDPRKFTIHRACETPERMAWIADEVWPQWGTRLDELEAPQLSAVMNAVHLWVSVARGVSPGSGDQLPGDYVQAGRDAASSMLGDLREAVRSHNGLAARWNELAGRLGLADRLDVDDDYAAFVLDRWAMFADEDTRDQHQARLDAKAQEWSEQSPSSVLARLRQLLEQADAADRTAGHHVARALSIIGTHAPDPAAWLHPVLEHDLAGYARGLMGAVLKRQPDRSNEWLSSALADFYGRAPALLAALDESAPTRASEQAVAALTTEDSHLIDPVVFRKSEIDSSVSDLLTHTEPAIAAATALECRITDGAHGPRVSDQWYDEWLSAMSKVEVEHLTQHQTWRLQHLLTDLATVDPDAAVSWHRQQLNKDDTKYGLLLEFELRETVSRLPRPQRQQVVAAATGWHGAIVLDAALDQDPEFAAHLLDDEAV